MTSLRSAALSATARLVVSLVLGLVLGSVSAVGTDVAHGSLIGIAVTTTVFVVLGMLVLWPMSGTATRQEARHESLGPMIDELVIGFSAVGGIVVTAALLAVGGEDAGYGSALIALLCVFMIWAGLHLMYATRYAYIYYDADSDGGISFGIDKAPAFREFVIFSYAIGVSSGIPGGMSVTDAHVLSVSFRHGLLAYAFRTIIMAAAINVVVNVFTG